MLVMVLTRISISPGGEADHFCVEFPPIRAVFWGEEGIAANANDHTFQCQHDDIREH